MRVISGSVRGKKLMTLDGIDVRPTIDRVKESVFNIIQFFIAESCVLDLFAGSGQLGIEALSRGAKSCYFIDNSVESLNVVNLNLKNTNLINSAKVVKSKAVDFLNKTNETFDIALLDPPYRKGLLQEVLPLLVDKMNENSIIVCEHPTDEELEESYGLFEKSKVYKYGNVSVSVYRR